MVKLWNRMMIKLGLWIVGKKQIRKIVEKNFLDRVMEILDRPMGGYNEKK